MSSRTEEVRRQGESDALVAVSQKRRSLIPAVYRRLLSDAQTRRLLLGLGVSALGDGMSTVSIAWLAVLLAPSGHVGVFVGIAVAAYTLPGVVGALALGRFLRHRPARVLVLTHTWLRAGFLATMSFPAPPARAGPRPRPHLAASWLPCHDCDSVGNRQPGTVCVRGTPRRLVGPGCLGQRRGVHDALRAGRAGRPSWRELPL